MFIHLLFMQTRATPLYTASQNGCYNIVVLLLEKGAQIDKADNVRSCAVNLLTFDIASHTSMCAENAVFSCCMNACYSCALFVCSLHILAQDE